MEDTKMIAIDLIEPNPYQPRLEFDQDALMDLAQSIRENGLIQPITVRKVNDKYQIIAGERRFRALRLNGAVEVPANIMDADEVQMAEMALVENIQRENLSAIEEASKTKGRVTGVATGFTELDYKLTGLHPAELILVAARPAMGKTAFVLNIAQYAAFKDNHAVAMFSLEMSKEQLVTRLMASESMVDSQQMRTGDLRDSDWEKLLEGAALIGNSKLIIDDTATTLAEIRSKCRKYKQTYGIELVVIDYLQLMSGSESRRNESRQQEISEISRALKVLARELDVPIIALSQLSRAVEARQDHKPMLSDLRESGAIEQDADVVMFLYRDEYYNPDSEKKNLAEVIVAKQRNGATGSGEYGSDNTRNLQTKSGLCRVARSFLFCFTDICFCSNEIQIILPASIFINKIRIILSLFIFI